MRIQILDLAKDDLIEGFHFYERREEGVGSRFLESLYSDIESLGTFGGLHRKPSGGFHRALAKTFPFAIYYTVDRELVQIRAIVDCRRRPSWIRRHLRRA
jgi:plasmid stabilization system protein ParE